MDKRWSLFQGFGVEIEYMIVDAKTLSVRPIADDLLRSLAGDVVSEVEMGPICWSNELALHVIELKSNGPAVDLTKLVDDFATQVRSANDALRQLGSKLMPGGMHPWMNPDTEMKIWPHEYNIVYQTYDRIFNCHGHGWANLQSTHLNLPFANDEEFARLHAAIRLLMPILPAFAASSPIADRQVKGPLDYRMQVYNSNSARIPSVTGKVIPEQVYSESDYDREIMQPLFRDIAPHDPEGVLQHPFMNARGAIGRFDRGAIEIRIVDAQECPQADMAIVAFEVEVLKELVAEKWCDFQTQSDFSTDTLAALLQSTIIAAEQTVLNNENYLRAFGITESKISASELCAHLITSTGLDGSPWSQQLQHIQQQGPLARRILSSVGSDFESRLEGTYRDLCDCLQNNEQFHA
ncbi:MAG: glutamate-cysteine ligase family protein [Planctomycetaceae bacterium]